MGHGYFAIAGWGVVLSSDEFLALIAPYLDPETRDDPTDEEFEAAFLTFLNVKSPGLGPKIELHYDAQHSSAETFFATPRSSPGIDVRGANGNWDRIPTEAPEEYAHLVAACGEAGKAGLTLFGYEGP